MGSSSMKDQIPCPQCGHPADLSVESNCCHDWSELHCGFCGYSREVDYDNPDQAAMTEHPGFGVMLSASRAGEGSFISLSVLDSNEDLTNAIACMPKDATEDHLWVRLTRWNSEKKTVEIVREVISPGFEVPSEMALDFFLPADHKVWWAKEQAATV